MSRATSATIGVLVGGAVGAIAALLFAPKRGKELRSDVVDWTRDTEKKAAGKIRDAGSSVASTIRRVPQMVSEKAPEVVSAAKGMFRKGSQQSERMAEDVETVSEGAARRME